MTNTATRLQQHLQTECKELMPGYFSKEKAQTLHCNDGTTLSVQASETHYCLPRDNFGPWHAVEVWCINGMPSDNNAVTEFEYDHQEPSGYVPVDAVVKFIDNHGGFKE